MKSGCQDYIQPSGPPSINTTIVRDIYNLQESGVSAYYTLARFCEYHRIAGLRNTSQRSANPLHSRVLFVLTALTRNFLRVSMICP